MLKIDSVAMRYHIAVDHCSAGNRNVTLEEAVSALSPLPVRLTLRAGTVRSLVRATAIVVAVHLLGVAAMTAEASMAIDGGSDASSAYFGYLLILLPGVLDTLLVAVVVQLGWLAAIFGHAKNLLREQVCA